MNRLQRLLQDDPANRFLAENWCKVPYSRPQAAAEFIDYITWKDLDTIALAGNSGIKVVEEGRIIENRQTFTAGKLKEHFEQGRSLVIRHSEKSHRALKELAQSFQDDLKGDIDIQIFVTPTKQQTFGWHYDAEEVFIMQTRGSKEYSLRQNTINPHPRMDAMPEDLDFGKETSRVFLSCTLLEGDWLYVPKGWWHKAQAQEGGSIHLSIGVTSD